MNKRLKVLVSCFQSDEARKQGMEMTLDESEQQQYGMGVTFTMIINGHKKSIYLDKDVAHSFLQNCLKQFEDGQIDLV